MSTPFTDKNPKFFYEREDFTELLFLEDHTLQITKELCAVLKEEFEPHWLQAFPDYVEGKHPKSWRTLPFLFFGMRNTLVENSCPLTTELISRIPGVITAEFSFMQPHTHIQPHVGYSKMILRCHLPLIVPDGQHCGIRVGDQIRHWREGELLVFDDSFEHEAWNKSAERRVLLMFDIPNPLWGYTAKEICRYKIENLNDPFLLSLANKQQWLEAHEKGLLPGHLGS